MGPPLVSFAAKGNESRKLRDTRVNYGIRSVEDALYEAPRWAAILLLSAGNCQHALSELVVSILAGRPTRR